MKDLNDKALRQQFIQRYLDGETTMEEELALAHFYQHSDGNFSAEEEAVRQLVLATSHLADDFMPSAEKAEEFDRIMAKSSRTPRRIGLWPWLAAACAAAILAIVLAPPKNEEGTPSQPPTKPTSCHQKEVKEDPLADTSEVMPKTFLASTPPSAATPRPKNAEDDQSDLISVDSVFGVKSHPDPLAEYTALTEKLQRECDEIFQIKDNNY
ncbi:MAG: hypothetical protein J6Y38_05260 [Bacteroidaceae bacterium]|jgi:hypothetical protein|nr:hypothetical protein [Bacteroidaceae bacterium]